MDSGLLFTRSVFSAASVVSSISVPGLRPRVDMILCGYIMTHHE